MREEKGDLWTYPADLRIVPTNGVVRRNKACSLVMGAGVALQAAQRYPNLPMRLGTLVAIGGNRPHLIGDYGIVSWPTKHHWKDQADLGLLLGGAVDVVKLVQECGAGAVAMPRIGCGLGGLDWKDVRPKLANILDDRFVVLIPE